MVLAVLPLKCLFSFKIRDVSSGVPKNVADGVEKVSRSASLPVRISIFPLFALKTAAARPAVTRRSMCSSNLSIYSSVVSSSSNRAFTRTCPCIIR